ncbi:hypothetical protein [Niabella terrae]
MKTLLILCGILCLFSCGNADNSNNMEDPGMNAMDTTDSGYQAPASPTDTTVTIGGNDTVSYGMADSARR